MKYLTARISIAALLGLALISVGLVRLGSEVRRDLHADLTWMHVGAPVEMRSRAWKWYPLTYPVLDRWLQTGDGDSAQYAFETIVHFGGPFAKLWLQQNIERDATPSYFPYDGLSSSLEAFGLSTSQARYRIALQAAKHVASEDGFDQHFDAVLLAQLGPDALTAIEQALRNTPWQHQEKLFAALPYDRKNWTTDERARADRLEARSNAYERATNPEVEQRSALSIAAERLTNGDRSMLAVLAPHVNGDLRAFNTIDYMPNLIAVAQAFPQSRLTRGYRAYDALRGDTYFYRNDAIDEALPVRFLDTNAWKTWIAAFADHPGADDAAYWLGRALQSRGERVAALRTYADALERQLGDGDMRDVIAGRMLWMLDVATTDNDLKAYIQAYPKATLTPIVSYARAVRAARVGDFTQASKLRPKHLEQYIDTVKRLGLIYDTSGLSLLMTQQQTAWQQLNRASQEQVEDAWNSDDGWKIGYLVFFNESRDGGTGYIGDSGLAPDILVRNMQLANPNAHVISYAATRIRHASQAEQRPERQRLIVALYQQIAEYPDQETEAMERLPDLPVGVGQDTSLYSDPHSIDTSYMTPKEAASARQQHEIDMWWTRQTVFQVHEYARLYPNDGFTSTALLSAFEVTGRTSYLHRLIETEPNGDRTEEARALLWRAHQ